MHPPFVMSQYASREDLDRAKAAYLERQAQTAATLKSLWPTPLAEALTCGQVAERLGIAPVAAGRLLSALRSNGLVACRSDAKCDSQRDAVRRWDTTEAGDELVALVTE